MENLKLVSRECFLSFSRIYHRIYMEGDVITVVQYLPRFGDNEETAEASKRRDYKYFFQIPDNPEYTESKTR